MIFEYSYVSERHWNDALKEAEHEGTIFQSTHWADYVRTILKDKPIFLFSTDKKGNIDGLLLAVQSCYGKNSALTPNPSSARGKVHSQIYKHVLGSIYDKVLPFVTWQHGPVIPRRDQIEQNLFERIYRNLIEEIFRIAEQRNFYAIRFARPSYFADPTELLSSFGLQKRKMGTILIDLRQPIDVTWKRLNKKTRNTLRKVISQVQTTEVSKLSELQDFYDLHIQATRRQGTKTYPFSHFESLWNFFSVRGKIAAFTTFFKEKPVGASICLLHQGIIHEYTYADSDYARSKRIFAIDALKWHIIKWAHNRNMEFFDLSGVEFYRIESGSEKARDIYRFKKKWGGNVVTYHDYWKDCNSRIVGILDHFLEGGEGFHT